MKNTQITERVGATEDKREEIAIAFMQQEEQLEYCVTTLESISNQFGGIIKDIRDHGYNRNIDEIIKELDVMVAKLWYNRHWCRICQRVIDGEKIQWETWGDKAFEAADKIEQKYGEENLEYDDFEWGMLNGKISALRWVLGDEWDFLDT